MAGPNAVQSVSPAIPEGSEVVTISIVCVVQNDDEAIALKRKINDAVTGVNVIRNTIQFNNMPKRQTTA